MNVDSTGRIQSIIELPEQVIFLEFCRKITERRLFSRKNFLDIWPCSLWWGLFRPASCWTGCSKAWSNRWCSLCSCCPSSGLVTIILILSLSLGGKFPRSGTDLQDSVYSTSIIFDSSSSRYSSSCENNKIAGLSNELSESRYLLVKLLWWVEVLLLLCVWFECGWCHLNVKISLLCLLKD